MATLTKTEFCPRCAGRLLRTGDLVSRYMSCLMCGYVKESRQLDAAIARAEVETDGREEPRLRTHARLAV
jgi:hypothetical protein